MNILNRTWLRALPLFMAAGFCATACDDISENERFTGPTPLEIQKKVLIEDFTGQNCLNCPKAATVVSDLQEALLKKFGTSHIVAVAIHGGSMSMSSQVYPFGLATPQGDDYNSHWGVDSWPKGMVDRSGGLLEYTSWTAKTLERLQQSPAVNLEVLPEYDEDSRRLKIKVLATANEEVSGLINVWLTESGIVSLQVLPDGSMSQEYVHNHVFRDAITAAYGDAFEANPDGETEYTYEYNIPLGYGQGADYPVFNCKPENMAVVAFVTEANGLNVLQVEDAPVK